MSCSFLGAWSLRKVSFAVDHAAFGSRITTFAHPYRLPSVARKRIHIDGDVVVGRSRLPQHFKCTSAINIDQCSLTARASKRQPSRRRAAERHLVARDSINADDSPLSRE